MDDISSIAHTKLSADAIKYADTFTGLSGDFDKDFARQLTPEKK